LIRVYTAKKKKKKEKRKNEEAEVLINLKYLVIFG
jgi:hypothetical protein